MVCQCQKTSEEGNKNEENRETHESTAFRLVSATPQLRIWDSRALFRILLLAMQAAGIQNIGGTVGTFTVCSQ